MSKQKIIENNKLIAEFMGTKMIVENYHGINIIEFPDKSTKDLLGLKYHSSWDWLMPVVEKIEKENVTGFTYRYYDEPNWGIELYVVTSHYFLNSYNKLNKSFECKSSSKIESYWLACVEFIKYYNLCQKEK